MTERQFVEKWKDKVAGVICLGGSNLRRSLSGAILTDEQVGKALNHISEATENLLKQLYNELCPGPAARLEAKIAPPAAKPVVNGNGKH